MTTYQPMRSLESAPGRVWTAWRSPERFTKNPDMVALPDGRLLAVYADTDKHWAEGLIRLTLIESRDRGRTWSLAGILAESDRTKREPHWVTPRLSRLRDGRLAVVCDLDDYEHCHEWQEPGIYLWWSEDDGRTWSEPVNTGVHGIEPDRIVELPDGRLSMGAHMTCADTQKVGEFIWRSPDGGKTWGPPVAVAKDAVHLYCEGAYVPLADGTLVCVIRDNLHNNYSSQVAFSLDNGDSWTQPMEAPVAGDRPFAGQLADGRLLVTFRNQGGNRGTYAWLGHLQHELGYRVSALHKGPEEISLSREAGLRIAHRALATTQYNLLPPESYRSEVLFEAAVRVAASAGSTGSPDERCAYVQLAHVNVKLSIAPNGLYLGEPDLHHQLIDRHWPVDMTEWHVVHVHHKGGLVRVFLDGRDVLRFRLLLPGPFVSTCFGTPPSGTGQSWWRYAKYHVRNQTEPEHFWLWDARSGTYPDQYELDRLLELHANTHERPDNGYSTWLQFDDGEILVLDYTNQGDPLGQSHIVGCSLRVEDFETMGRRPQER
ncbi:MAG: exo-alpha-sialidase [Chloroflexi bacterium]|nr:exo-alpha-sialidase [Chloroflexota bacterium]